MKLDYKCLADYLTAIIALFGFIITICSLIKNNKEKSISNVISLKAELREYNDIYFKLLPNGEWSNLQPNYFNEHENELGKLYSYLGLFE
ncbi:MAG: hypothetical protein WCL06_08410, partial [Bacteroidota bacterium]